MEDPVKVPGLFVIRPRGCRWEWRKENVCNKFDVNVNIIYNDDIA
jgi:hypothetical protein